MMKKVTLEDLVDFMPRARLCGGRGKSIDVVTDPIEKTVWYEFSVDRKIVYTGDVLSTAIKLYNEV